jgi:AcrR family transcriptional regulator/DNA-binding PadR family transcriptional regulator
MAANAPDARLRVRNATHAARGARGGGLCLSESQRVRLLDAVFAVVAERGYRGMAARAVAERAGVSSKAFYELFGDREGCFLAAFDHGVERLTSRARPAYAAEREWAAGIRAGLGALLVLLDREPALCGLVFVEALGAGPRVLARRAEVLDGAAGLLEEGRRGAGAVGGLPALTAAGVVGAVFGVIHARLVEREVEPGRRVEPLTGLLNELMATIVLPYRGRAAAARELASSRELELPALSASRGASRSRTQGAWRALHASERGRRDAPPIAALPADFRLTVRTQMALVAVARCSARGANPSNLEVARRIGVSAKGAVSRMMTRLQGQGLVENTHGRGTKGLEKAWRLTPRGQAVLDAHRPGRAINTNEPAAVRGGRLVPKRGQARPAPSKPASAGFRLTVRTYLVLSAVAELAGRGSAELGGRGSYPSSREIAHAAGVRDEGQLSKLLARLQGRGLVHNTARASHGNPKAWRLTPQGEALLDANPAHTRQAA